MTHCCVALKSILTNYMYITIIRRYIFSNLADKIKIYPVTSIDTKFDRFYLKDEVSIHNFHSLVQLN